MPSTSPSEGQRFSQITPWNHAGILWITALLSSVYAVLALLARIHIKRHKWWHDDTICVIATILSIGSLTSICIGMSYGFGKSATLLGSNDPKGIGQSIFGSQILLIAVLALAKCSVMLLIKRCLALDMKKKRKTCDIAIGSVILWALGSIIGISVMCNPSHMLSGIEKCSKQPLRWAIIGVLDGVTEVLVVLLSAMLIWGLNLETEKRFRVVISFTFRLLLIPIIALQIYYLKQAYSEGGDIPLIMTKVLCCQQVEMGYALITATLPNLKSFIQSFDTTLMMTVRQKLKQDENAPGLSTSGPPQLPYPIPYVEDHPLNSLYQASFSNAAPSSRMPSSKSRHRPVKPPRVSANFKLQNEQYSTKFLQTNHSMSSGAADDSPIADKSFKTYNTEDAESITKVHGDNWPLRQASDASHARQSSIAGSQDHPLLHSPLQRNPGWIC